MSFPQIGNHIGLNSNYWIQPPTTEVLYPSEMKRLVVSKDKFILDESATLDEHGYYACVHEYMVGLLKNESVYEEIR